MRCKINGRWIEYRNPIDLLDRPSNLEVGFNWYQQVHGKEYSYNLIDHNMVNVKIIIV